MPKKQTRIRKSRRRQRNRSKSRRRNMRGGSFTPDEIQNLKGHGLSDYQLESLEQLGVTFADVTQKMNSISNQGEYGFSGNSDDMAEQVVTELLNEHIFNNPNTGAMDLDPIPHANDDDHDMDMDDDELNLSQNSNNSLHLSDLSQGSNMSGYTTDESMEWGGKRKRNKKSSKHIKKRKGRGSRKQKGGKCFGSGVGSNSNDPNFSVYNTNMLKLFPYTA